MSSEQAAASAPVGAIVRHPSSFERHRGTGRRFHTRSYKSGLFQVYGVGMEHVCECTTGEMADMVAAALEQVGERIRCRACGESRPVGEIICGQCSYRTDGCDAGT